MDFGNFLCAKLIIMVAALAMCKATLKTLPGGAYQMGHRAEMPCVYEHVAGDTWIFMRWKKGDVILANVLMSSSVPEWTESAPENFRDHVELNFKRMEGKNYTLSMTIDGLQCTDVGQYSCEAFTMNSAQAMSSSTNIDIIVSPGVPRNSEDFFEAKENVTFNLRCSANVGIPPATINWKYAEKGIEVWKLVDPTLVSQSNTQGQGDTCWYHGESKVTVTMSEALDGARYMCLIGPEVDPGKKNYAEVTLVLLGKTTTSTTPKPTTTALKPQESVYDGNNSDVNGSSVYLLLFTFVLAIVNNLTMYL